MGGRPEHLCIDWLLSQFGGGRRAARRAYVAFVAEGDAGTRSGTT